jgi:hypothetical protein
MACASVLIAPALSWYFYFKTPYGIGGRHVLRLTIQLAITLLLVASFPAMGAQIVDPVGDFLDIYTGPLNGDLDVLEAEVFYNGSSFQFTSTSAANIGTTPGGVFVWGINRGAGFATFPGVAPGVTFDAVVVLAPGATSFVVDLATEIATDLDAAAVSFSGAFLSGTVAASLLPSLGAAPEAYTVNLWPRSELVFVDEVISDFAPDNSNAAVTVVPEPGTFVLFGAAGIAMFAWRRTRRLG